MSKFIINGGKKLEGEIEVAANKNAVLPLMAASILTDNDVILHNVPYINDIIAMSNLLEDLGASVSRQERTLTINCAAISKSTVDPNLAKRLRASVLFLGPLLARAGKITMPHPGGDIIGQRGIESHLDGLSKLGVEAKITDQSYKVKIINRKGGTVFLDQPTVTGTENIIMFAALNEKETVIENAASEPHIVCLSELLKKMGVYISGAGTNTITIRGRKKLDSAEHQISPDFIEAGTFAVMGALTDGNIYIKSINEKDTHIIKIILERFGVNMTYNKNSILIKNNKLTASLRPVQAAPWPGFPTDLMSPLIVLATQAKGQTLCHDPMYESRMFFVDKLISMGAKITICDPHRVIVYGPSKLYGRHLASPDIRAGMALVLAALISNGESIIEDAEIIERGYERLDKRLSALGADIKRTED